MPALAPGDPRDIVHFNGLPPGVVADRAGHDRW
jgi:hypothetical protein